MYKTDKVQKDGQNASKIWFQNGTKNNNTSSHILLDHKNPLGFSVYAVLLKKKFLKEGYRLGPILPCLGSTPGRIRPKNDNTCRGPWALHSYQVSSKSLQWFWRSRKCEKFTDDRRTDDGRTTHYDNSSLEPSARLRWAKNRGPVSWLWHGT